MQIYTFKTIIAVLTLLIPTAHVHAQATTGRSPGAIACSMLGDTFYTATSMRDHGLSFKDDIDMAADTAQKMPNPLWPPLGYVKFYALIATNARWNPQYQHTGPSMNKLLAESRCTSVGFQAFYAELEEFGKTLSKQ